ncbi:MAG TPA: trypsin-like peptidase domain-containing protein [Gaiellaceae bacterium]|jgi:putative serine protease PepD|nr:trypsin-like peptidase domain-containing protein [Gaiellaceae bacterium]
MKRFRVPFAILVASALVAVGAGFASSKSATSTASSTSAATALQNAFASVYSTVSPSVVQIQTSEGLGSGIVFDSKGDIVTNDHVVGTAKTFTVTTSAGKKLTGKLVGTFAEDDLAVIKVSAAGLHPASFADSNSLRIGDIAMAIGNPLGLSSSFTEGLVSALNRQEPEGNGVILPSAIQTSAAINPGNSGGALVNIHGAVIGIPTLAAEDPQLGGAAAGIGFAIPSNTVKSIASQLIDTGKVTNSNRAFLGIETADTGEASGVYITQVLPGSAAGKAGLVAGDLITAVNTTPTPTSSDLGTALAALKPGQTVTIKYSLQSGAKKSVQVTLGEVKG